MTGVVLSVVQLLLLAFVISSAAALAIASVLRRVDIASELAEADSWSSAAPARATTIAGIETRRRPRDASESFTPGDSSPR